MMQLFKNNLGTVPLWDREALALYLKIAGYNLGRRALDAIRKKAAENLDAAGVAYIWISGGDYITIFN